MAVIADNLVVHLGGLACHAHEVADPWKSNSPTKLMLQLQHFFRFPCFKPVIQLDPFSN